MYIWDFSFILALVLSQVYSQAQRSTAVLAWKAETGLSHPEVFGAGEKNRTLPLQQRG